MTSPQQRIEDFVLSLGEEGRVALARRLLRMGKAGQIEVAVVVYPSAYEMARGLSALLSSGWEMLSTTPHPIEYMNQQGTQCILTRKTDRDMLHTCVCSPQYGGESSVSKLDCVACQRKERIGPGEGDRYCPECFRLLEFMPADSFHCPAWHCARCKIFMGQSPERGTP